MLGQDSWVKTAWTGEIGQDSPRQDSNRLGKRGQDGFMTERSGKREIGNREGYTNGRTAMTGHSAYGTWDRTARTGRSGQVGLTGRSGHDREDRRGGHESKDRTARQYLEIVYFSEKMSELVAAIVLSNK